MSNRILNIFRAARRPSRGVALQARRLGRRRDGTTVVEFAIVIFPFLAIMFAIIETSIVFYASQVLETAVADSARLVMTGQAQKAGYNEVQFKAQVCARLQALFNCAEGVRVDVRRYTPAEGANAYSPFGGADLSLPLDEDGALDTSDFGYTPGIQGDIIVVRAVYEWPVIMPGFGFDVANLPNGKRLLMASAAFRNEPYINAAN